MSDKVEYEKCVVCGKETEVPTTMDIGDRSWYVEGSGQLCRECWRDVYETGWRA